MKKQAVILLALLFGFNLLTGTNASGHSDCASKCLHQLAKSGHGHTSGAAFRLVRLNCCSGNAALPCELGSHRTAARLDCSLATCRTKVPNSTNTSMVSRPVVADGLASSGTGLSSGTTLAGKAPPLYLQKLSILC